MASFYTDENVTQVVVDILRALGHDVLTALDDGRANQGIDDPEVLARATVLGRCVLTNNRYDYHKLHRADPNHAGIITYTDDPDRAALAARIDAAASSIPTLARQLVRVIRPNPSSPPTPSPSP